MSLRDLLDRVRTARVEAEACYCHDDLVCQLCGAVMGAEGELATWLLAHPEAVEAVEVLVALGKARAWAATCTIDDCEPPMWTSTMRAACRDRCRAEDAVNALADRLAEEVGRG